MGRGLENAKFWVSARVFEIVAMVSRNGKGVVRVWQNPKRRRQSSCWTTHLFECPLVVVWREGFLDLTQGEVDRTGDRAKLDLVWLADVDD